MRFTTDVALPLRELDILHNTPLMLMGSCFAQNIGQRLSDYKFNVDINPFGIIYNPLSVAEALRRICSGELFDVDSPEVFMHNGMWHSYLHHGSFSNKSKEGLLELLNTRLLAAHNNVMNGGVLMITFGTAYAYRLKENGMVVGNCHKLPQNMFGRLLLSVGEIVDAMTSVTDILLSKNPSLQILFTVSPIRHLRDGAHDNQLSKATLLLAVEELRRIYTENTHYFPSYEIMLDQLRDYRFFAEDMVHPSSVAINYIWECFGKCYFSSETLRLNECVAEIMRAMSHRPFDAASEEYHRFLNKILLKIAELQKKYPYFDFEKEILQCNTLLKR